MIEIGGNQRARGLVNMVDGVEHSNNFCRVIKDTAHCPHETRHPSAISGRFCSIAVFNSSNWKQYFSEFIVSLFGKSS